MENTPRTRPKVFFYLSSALPKMVSFSIKIAPLCDTCDSKKSTSLLEGARVYTRARARGLDVDKQSEDTRRKGYEKAGI